MAGNPGQVGPGWKAKPKQTEKQKKSIMQTKEFKWLYGWTMLNLVLSGFCTGTILFVFSKW